MVVWDEIKKIERVLEVFEEFWQESTLDIDIAYFRKNCFYLYVDDNTREAVESGEQMCRLLLTALASEYARKHGYLLGDLPDDLLDKRNAQLQLYLDNLSEYQFLLDEIE